MKSKDLITSFIFNREDIATMRMVEGAKYFEKFTKSDISYIKWETQ